MICVFTSYSVFTTGFNIPTFKPALLYFKIITSMHVDYLYFE